MAMLRHHHGVVRLEHGLGVDRRVRRGAQVYSTRELAVELSDHQTLARPVTDLLDGRRQVVQLLVAAATQERLPELGQERDVGEGGVAQRHEGPAHAALPRYPVRDTWYAACMRGVFIR